ncbi:VOC family protein [Paraflavitalea pollutisoli]|uniref:VOC family protein n=1 Tax=Paraflavitalea pollutisoli TaxID=3034143 RepID=UPI0023EA8F26|nr:VOC family protein [Paraflavitalea sp. H1-2-19X]
MSTLPVPQTDCERLIPLLIVNNIPQAVEFYVGKLGFTHVFTWGEPPEIAGVNLGKVSVHLYEGTPADNSVYFVVNDADELYGYHQSQGVDILFPPGDRPYELRDYAIRDPWGNKLSFGHYIQLKTPALPIERVEVPVRLEKRLAALLADLAEHKGMTIGSCLEETLLHTFEVLGEDKGVASPHTKKTHAYIQELKKKHGIDYDTHASYRFVE